MLPCARYRTPPWASLVARLEVPLAKSVFSTSSVRRPREAASSAVPRPVAPPPITKQSQTVERSEIAWIAISRLTLLTRPRLRATHGLIPLAAQFLALVSRHFWLEGAVDCPLGLDFIRRLVESGGETGQVRRTHGSCF